MPTKVLYDAYLTEGGVEEAAEEFGLDPEAVTEAVRFERKLDSQLVH